MTSAHSRVQVIDSIRGFALWGILIFNIQTYALFTFLDPEQVYQLQLDQPESYAPLQFIFHVFVNGQFYTIYSFLFGLGFYLLWQKNMKAGLPADKIFKRRLWVLLGIGLIHGLLFWFGDILHKYALFGFVLIYFNKKSINTIFKWIVGLLLFSVVLQTLTILLGSGGSNNDNEIDPVILQVVNSWQHGSFFEVMGLQKLGVAMLWFMGIMNGMTAIASYLVMFLLGLIAGKSNFFRRIPDFKKQMLHLVLLLFPIGLVLKGLAHLDILEIHLFKEATLNKLFSSLSNFIAVPMLTISYLIFLTLLFSKVHSPVFKWIGNAGRLGLTNYLMQTVICMLLFYGYAGGLSGKLTLLQTFLCTIPIFCFQVLFSNIWLKYYKSGPMEKLWRKLSSS